MGREARLARWLALAALACGSGLSAAQSGELWQEGDVLVSRREPLDAVLGRKLTFTEETVNPSSGELKSKVQHRWAPWLETAATYKFSHARGRNGNGSSAHAIELDLVPSWKSGDTGRLSLTQRIAGVRLFEAAPARYRYHMIPKLTRPAAWLRGQTGVEASAEAIYDLTGSEWVEIKLTPLRMQFSAGPGRGWWLAYLMNDKRGSEMAQWRRIHVVAVGVVFGGR